jgi:16S rRNA (guanine527-N7)-methyltransferase
MAHGAGLTPPAIELSVEPPAEAVPALEALVEILLEEDAPVSPRSAERAREVHIADSLSGLVFDQLRGARRIADLGSGAGLPGLVLAASLPGVGVDLIESVSRKCKFLRRAIERLRLANAAVVCARAEEWAAGGGREAYDAVTARALGRLPTIAELASPLLLDGGHLLAWKGRRDPEQERALARAASRLAMEEVEVRALTPYAGSRDRHIHLVRKNGATPDDLPRRPGMAAKRPFGPE